jgi:hypothetical protein
MNSSDNNNSRQSADALLLELYSYCRSDSLSEDGLREIIERNGGCAPKNNPHINDYEFFFAACRNERVNKGIIQYLLEYFPKAIRSVSKKGSMPLHYLCGNRKVVETTAMDILMLLLEKCPMAVRHGNTRGDLPVHVACVSKSPKFCQPLIEACPGSERVADVSGRLPLHCACMNNTVATVEYLYKLYPGATKHAATDGYHPIHYAIMSTRHRDSPATAVEAVKFLLDCDPDAKLQKYRGRYSLLRFACRWEYKVPNIEVALQVIKVIYDAHPEAIEDNEIASDIHRYHQRVQTFINSELVYSRQARNLCLMTTPDGKGRLLLHKALQNNVRIGSIKMLVKGNPSAIRSFDKNGLIPLHLACQHHESASVVQYLLDLDATTLDAVDKKGNTPLHYACHGAKYETITLLLEKYNAVSVSKRNADKKLPIDLLWESNKVLDRENVEYTESVFLLLRAYPETIINCIM